MTRLLLADDHRMLREGLRRALEAHGLDVIGEAADGEEAVRMAQALHPDVVLMDISMPVLDGIEATRQIRERAPQSQVIALTMHADDDTVQRVIRAGAVGYLVKDCSTAEVVSTVGRVASGEVALSPEIAASILAEAKLLRTSGAEDDPPVSKREEEVLQRIADGLSTSEVAQSLYISQKTVRNHLQSIYEKLDARDRTQAVLRAVRMGIVKLN